MTRSRDWWDGRSERQQAILAYVLPLLGTALAVLLMWTVRHLEGVATQHEARTLLRRVGFVCAIGVLSMLAFTRRWPLQQLGLLVLLAALADFFARVIGQWGPQPVQEWERDLIQAGLDVGAVMLLVSFVLFGFRQSGSGRWQRLVFVIAAAACVALYVVS